MLSGRLSLEEYLINERRKHAHATGDLNALIFAAARACKVISNQVAAGQLITPAQSTAQSTDHSALYTMAEGIFQRLLKTSSALAATLSPDRGLLPLGEGTAGAEAAKYLFLFDPMESAENLQFNVPAGSIFSIIRAGSGGSGEESDFLQPGSEQVCAGYAIYGPSTTLVLSVGSGTQGFTLDPILGEFVHTHRDICIPEAGRDFAINPVNHRFWEPAVRRYVDECVAGESGPFGHDFRMRWVASLVAEAHNILLRGGTFLNPVDRPGAPRREHVRLLYEANPIAFLIEQAGGRASTGSRRILELQPRALHQEVSLFFGCSREVERLERYHEETTDAYDAPLFGARGLFRD